MEGKWLLLGAHSHFTNKHQFCQQALSRAPAGWVSTQELGSSKAGSSRAAVDGHRLFGAILLLQSELGDSPKRPQEGSGQGVTSRCARFPGLEELRAPGAAAAACAQWERWQECVPGVTGEGTGGHSAHPSQW